ncbi:MAG: hypothetical protein A2X13_08980 [Bacteroidetes bacterium GWC2_33_15]|nr:MAG: hypothetical protein A2X10_01610 [Bacteroidetes bacterium GWA2_33_15]OFX49085.1 MAG: hypothetical protein A2X13_08980 [Bacteroidetes bacterium GWC2_33_15]OFX64853.1 MAG: hypothetical protein A2X15_05855 [Bacteroidetes bacterium GWB2_32_14]OFX68561.1 MAG: hypothetical protein A2X14_14420 [Bacteroidetes bacterium GWD2_33_33]
MYKILLLNYGYNKKSIYKLIDMKSKFNWQIFISFGLLFSFILIAFSGVILYIAPEGSFSRWIGWNVLGLSKKQWEGQHTVFSYIFIAFCIFHIFRINWELLVSYFKTKNFKLIYIKEIGITLILLIFVFTGTLMQFQPFSGIMNIGRNISQSFEKGVEPYEIPDAGIITLEQFAESYLFISFNDLESRLNELGFKTIHKSITIEEFCLKNNTIPFELYQVLKKEVPVKKNY